MVYLSIVLIFVCSNVVVANKLPESHACVMHIYMNVFMRALKTIISSEKFPVY